MATTEQELLGYEILEHYRENREPIRKYIRLKNELEKVLNTDWVAIAKYNELVSEFETLNKDK